VITSELAERATLRLRTKNGLSNNAPLSEQQDILFPIGAALFAWFVLGLLAPHSYSKEMPGGADVRRTTAMKNAPSHARVAERFAKIRSNNRVKAAAPG
jgi:hypothetical protein